MGVAHEPHSGTIYLKVSWTYRDVKPQKTPEVAFGAAASLWFSGLTVPSVSVVPSDSLTASASPFVKEQLIIFPVFAWEAKVLPTTGSLES